MIGKLLTAKAALGLAALAGLIVIGRDHGPNPWAADIAAIQAAADGPPTRAAVQAALDTLADDAKAAGGSLDAPTPTLQTDFPDLAAKYTQIVFGLGGAFPSKDDMALVADALHEARAWYEAGWTLNAIAIAYGGAS